MPSNLGTQTVTIKYFDPVDDTVMNAIALDIRKRGIYSGGYLTRINNTSVSISALSCEIGDASWQVRVATAVAATITVSTTLTTLVLRWNYTGSASADYMELLGVAPGSVLTNDLIVGVCLFSGATLTGFSYTTRANPMVVDLFLKVEPMVPASMYVRIRAGRVNYGIDNYDIPDQILLVTAPVSGTRIDVVQVSQAGAVILTAGTTVAPSYNSLITLAEITTSVGQTSITAISIKDVRNFISFGISNPVLTTGDQSIAGVKTFNSSPIVPTPTTNTQTANKVYVDGRTPGFGSWLTRSTSVIYLAATDGFVVGYNGNGQNAVATVYTDSSSNPTTIRASAWNDQSTSNGQNISFCVPVRKGDYWKVTGAASALNWIPLGV